MSQGVTAVDSLRELVDMVIARRIREGSTVDLCIDHPELATLPQVESLRNGLSRFGIRLIRRRGIPIDRIIIHPPGDCPKPESRGVS